MSAACAALPTKERFHHSYSFKLFGKRAKVGLALAIEVSRL